ncbi:hypothetical protein CIB93_15385 [Streptomyces sp. WZ.A104]|uniref:winged helix DNA-binding protein n=1 Tax=Streptomyces sp. WZ.A104 TaxID=2023771 RepID=UPI000BBBAF10|nr:winged helix DNA-binding protein [Streptomyces sp. WZ.A104]PCG85198.1 hypothetical protein CIB93_15385 [Streptomyces sp. WZ.A104]
MTSTTHVNGQIIGRAHYATRALLEGLLTTKGTTFHEAVALNAVADRDGEADHAALVERMTGTLKVDAATAGAVLAALTAAGLLRELPGEGARLGLTEAGRELQAGIATGTAELAARLYGDLPAEDLAAAARVLNAVTERANEALATT